MYHNIIIWPKTINAGEYLVPIIIIIIIICDCIYLCINGNRNVQHYKTNIIIIIILTAITKMNTYNILPF